MNKRKTFKIIHFFKKNITSSILFLLGCVGGYQLHDPIAKKSCDTLSPGHTQMFFSPKGGCQQAIVSTIQQAKHNIIGSIYCFNSIPIADALITAHQAGVQVRIVVDRSQINVKNTQLPRLYQHGIPIVVARGVKIMHEKTLVADGTYIFSGSFNWTNPAENANGEIAFLLVSQTLSKDYRQHWEKYWQSGRAYTP